MARARGLLSRGLSEQALGFAFSSLCWTLARNTIILSSEAYRLPHKAILCSDRWAPPCNFCLGLDLERLRSGERLAWWCGNGGGRSALSASLTTEQPARPNLRWHTLRIPELCVSGPFKSAGNCWLVNFSSLHSSLSPCVSLCVVAVNRMLLRSLSWRPRSTKECSWSLSPILASYRLSKKIIPCATNNQRQSIFQLD